MQTAPASRVCSVAANNVDRAIKSAKEAAADGRYLEATKEVLQKHGGLWFFDESYVISRRRE